MDWIRFRHKYSMFCVFRVGHWWSESSGVHSTRICHRWKHHGHRNVFIKLVQSIKSVENYCIYTIIMVAWQTTVTVLILILLRVQFAVFLRQAAAIHWAIMWNMMSSAKSEVHNISQSCQGRIEPLPRYHVQKFGEVWPWGFRVMRRHPSRLRIRHKVPIGRNGMPYTFTPKTAPFPSTISAPI